MILCLKLKSKRSTKKCENKKHWLEIPAKLKCLVLLSHCVKSVLYHIIFVLKKNFHF